VRGCFGRQAKKSNNEGVMSTKTTLNPGGGGEGSKNGGGGEENWGGRWVGANAKFREGG